MLFKIISYEVYIAFHTKGYTTFPKVFDVSATHNAMQPYIPCIFSKEPLA